MTVLPAPDGLMARFGGWMEPVVGFDPDGYALSIGGEGQVHAAHRLPSFVEVVRLHTVPAAPGWKFHQNDGTVADVAAFEVDANDGDGYNSAAWVVFGGDGEGGLVRRSLNVEDPSGRVTRVTV
jgi:hypothetical protein